MNKEKKIKLAITIAIGIIVIIGIIKIVDIYYEKKTGTVRILRDKNKTTLTLITCTKDDEAHQTIYIAELI